VITSGLPDVAQEAVAFRRRSVTADHPLKMECKIGTEVYYPVSMDLQECFAELGYKRGDLSASERAADETLALPIYPELNLEMIGTVVKGSFDFIKYGGMEADSQRLVSPTEAAWEEGRYKDCRRTVFPVFPHNTVT